MNKRTSFKKIKSEVVVLVSLHNYTIYCFDQHLKKAKGQACFKIVNMKYIIHMYCALLIKEKLNSKFDIAYGCIIRLTTIKKIIIYRNENLT